MSLKKLEGERVVWRCEFEVDRKWREVRGRLVRGRLK